MRDELDPTQLVTMYMTTVFDPDRAEMAPPQLPYEVRDERWRERALENAITAASSYDMFRDVVQVSFRQNGISEHILFCDDPAAEPVAANEEHCIIRVVDSEMELIVAVVDSMQRRHQELENGVVATPATFAGWKMHSEIWPTLVNKALAYGCLLPTSLITDPRAHYSTVKYLLDVSNIYSQGVSMYMRKLPALIDVLAYWKMDGLERRLPERISTLICEEPGAAAQCIEPYLLGMEKAVLNYFRVNTLIPTQTASVPVPLEPPIPAAPIPAVAPA